MVSRRKLNHQEKLRFRAVKLSQSGMEASAICEQLGICRRSLSRWLAAFTQYGFEGLRSRPQQGSKSRLSTKQREQVAHWLRASPRKFGFSHSHWTATMLQRLIEQRFGVTYNHRYLNSWMNHRYTDRSERTEQVNQRRH